MNSTKIPGTPPGDLYGKRSRDRTVRVLDAVVDARLKWAALINRRPRAPRVDDHRMALVVTERRIEAHDTDVISLVLRAPDERALPSWRPGAHLDLELPSGKLRQYSLCGDPADVHAYRVAVRRIPDGGGGSVEVHRDLAVGTPITVRGPRNAFPFAVPGHGSPATRLHFVAGGIGITPILPMMRLADRLGVDWSMVYTGRNRDTIPFLDEVERFGGRVTVRTDDEHDLPDASALLPGVDAGTAVYCCGPVPMTGMVADAVRQMPGVELHSERFSPPPIVDGVAFEIELASTGEVVRVPADRSALDVVLETRPDRPYSCRQGFCRTCTVRVLAGQPDHRETVLTESDHAAGDMLICVSRSAGGRLTLDI
ncbi:oxidoreductase [Nocardia cyriacigeorgica]|uniref:PDR/VanB family oxidoreductase n=1 Tax=Nocardia cyriacigeorgica TaxID=135487 RepID=UPI0013B7AB01|nr:PDR/VanB family oxidoreductase [Nocardia cyriacigeorgica]NEW40045.1 oxidoreductase [Nocardia cyriacigeorgica]NEW51629.1 oxidoreductase [Nocardia cyriacigeorgica]